MPGPDQERHIDLLYRRLAGEEFRPLLEDMLFELKFTALCQDAGDMALNNYAKRLIIRVFADGDGVVNSMSFFESIKRLIRRKR